MILRKQFLTSLEESHIEKSLWYSWKRSRVVEEEEIENKSDGKAEKISL